LVDKYLEVSVDARLHIRARPALMDQEDEEADPTHEEAS
jgi:hypothetical protein